jgi:hypothetical protein
MPAYAKLLIGIAAALLAGWIAHGPFGQGRAFADRLETQATAVVAEAEMTEVTVRVARAPLARRVLLAGPADAFQREGQGLFPGLNDRILSIPGIAALAWADEPAGGVWPLPLLVETGIIVLIAFLAGLGIARLRFRQRREGYL